MCRPKEVHRVTYAESGFELKAWVVPAFSMLLYREKEANGLTSKWW